MGANSSSAHEPKPSLLAEEETEREVGQEAWWKAEWHLRQRAEFLQRLFPIESMNDDTDVSSSFSQQHATAPESDGKQTSSSYLVLMPPKLLKLS